MRYFRQSIAQGCADILLALLSLALIVLLIAFKLKFHLVFEPFNPPALILFEALLLVIAPLALLLMMPMRRPWLRIVLSLVLGVYYLTEVFLIAYYFSSKQFFDFYFFWFHRTEALETLNAVYTYLPLRVTGVIAVLAIMTWSFSQTNLVKHQYHGATRVGMVTLIGAWVAALVFLPGTPLKQLVIDASITRNIINFSAYADFYGASLKAAGQQTPSAEPGDGRSIMLLQLESVNSEFVTPEITPQLYHLAREGVLLTRHSSTAVQTRRAYEGVLCSALPSIHSNAFRDFTQANASLEIDCLPEILKRAGYRTLFFQNYNTSFQGVGDFMRYIGFDEVHGSEIMEPGDPTSSWGDREDVFFSRVFEYIRSRYDTADKLFVYIIVGATNHHPFTLDDSFIRGDVYAKLPRPDDDAYLNRRSNMLFAQDAYLEDFWREARQSPPLDTSDLYIFGDHPIAINRESPEYSFNGKGVSQQNFQTALLYLSKATQGHPIPTGRVIADDLGSSHRGIAPTILESIGIPNPFFMSSSFRSIFTSAENPAAQCVVNVQPYFHPAVALVQYPHKVVLDLWKDRVGYLDLGVHDASKNENYRTIDDSLDRTDDYLAACIRNDLSSMLRKLSE